MPDNSYIQYGSFGVVVFLVGWFVLYGFPRMLEAISSAVDRFLLKIDAIENRCNQEREKMMQEFRNENAAVREAHRTESEADRVARHKSVNDFTEIISKLVTQRQKD